MAHPNETEFIFKGEVAEILGNNSSIKTKVICRPGSLIIEVPSVKKYHLGEQVILKGKFICESIDHINNNNTNH